MSRGRIRRWFAPVTLAFFLVCLGLAGGSLPAAAEVTTPGKGSPQRTAILEAIRPAAEAELGAPVEFVVREMRVLGEWAFVILQPQRKGGGPIEYAYTKYQSAVDEGVFGGEVIGLLRLTPKGWLVYQYDLGATDVPWVDWPTMYAVPDEVFPHY